MTTNTNDLFRCYQDYCIMTDALRTPCGAKNEQPLPSSIPVNKSDYNSYIHDLKYKHAKEDYLKDPTPENKKRQMNKVWQADDNFIRAMDNDYQEPMAKVAGKLIQAKETAEKLGAPTTFSGFGTSEEEEISDPVARLRNLVEQEYKSETKHKKTQKGGFILAPLAIGAATAIGSKLAGELYDFVKKKLTSGSGIKIPNHKTRQQKIEFIKEFIIRLK